jgi:hypothetical protein
MSHTVEDSLLGNEYIGNARKFLAEYNFTVGDLETVITIRLYQDLDGRSVHFRQSHFIHTPTQAGPYRTSRPWNDDEGAALNQAVTSITQYYGEAVKAGHEPKESWLVPNQYF